MNYEPDIIQPIIGRNKLRQNQTLYRLQQSQLSILLFFPYRTPSEKHLKPLSFANVPNGISVARRQATDLLSHFCTVTTALRQLTTDLKHVGVLVNKL